MTSRAAAVIRRLPVGAETEARGRVLVHQDGRALVHDATGNLEVRLPHGAAPPPPGALVTTRGVWDGSQLVAEVFEVATVPERFPMPDGDFGWFSADGGRRLELLRRRAEVLAAVREAFDGWGFVEVETPTVVRSPGLEVHLSAFEVSGFQDGTRYLGTSPEYHMKRLLAAGLGRIFQICRCYRKDEAGARHEPEFTMLEWYRAFAGAEEITRDTEELVAHVARTVNGTTMVTRGGREIDLAPPWDRITVADAFARHAGIDVSDVLADETRFFEVFATEVEPALGWNKPIFLTHWPKKMASLARLDPNDPSVAERVEAFAGGLELSNGFGELVDATEQRARLLEDDAVRAARGLPRYPIDERFLAALSEGIPPSGGNALGLDRLVMLVLGVEHIEDIVAFASHRA